MLNPIERFKVAILHLNRNWNHCYGDFSFSTFICKDGFDTCLQSLN